MVGTVVLAGVSSATLLSAWLYWKERQWRKCHELDVAIAAARKEFFLSKIPDHENLWLFERCDTFVITDSIKQRDNEFLLMEGEAIKARFLVGPEKVITTIAYIRSQGCPVGQFG